MRILLNRRNFSCKAKNTFYPLNNRYSNLIYVTENQCFHKLNLEMFKRLWSIRVLLCSTSICLDQYIIPFLSWRTSKVTLDIVGKRINPRASKENSNSSALGSKENIPPSHLVKNFSMMLILQTYVCEIHESNNRHSFSLWKYRET